MIPVVGNVVANLQPSVFQLFVPNNKPILKNHSLFKLKLTRKRRALPCCSQSQYSILLGYLIDSERVAYNHRQLWHFLSGFLPETGFFPFSFLSEPPEFPADTGNSGDCRRRQRKIKFIQTLDFLTPILIGITSFSQIKQNKLQISPTAEISLRLFLISKFIL